MRVKIQRLERGARLLDKGVLDPFLRAVLADQVARVFRRAEKHGFGFLCYGDFVAALSKRPARRAAYNRKKDRIKIAVPEKLRARAPVYGETFVIIPKKSEENMARRLTRARFRKTLAHELGHRLYHQFPAFIDREAVAAAYGDFFSGAFASKYAHKSESEMFAEAFACYLYPHFFRKKCDVLEVQRRFASFLRGRVQPFAPAVPADA